MKFYKWAHFHHLLFMIFQMERSKPSFESFLQRFVLKSGVIKKMAQKGPELSLVILHDSPLTSQQTICVAKKKF